MLRGILYQCSKTGLLRNRGGRSYCAIPNNFCSMVRKRTSYTRAGCLTFLLDAALLFPYASACILLQHLEEVIARTDQGSGDEYLRVLISKFGSGGTTEALHALQGVRLALAMYFSRCTMIGTGGKHILERKFIAAV